MCEPHGTDEVDVAPAKHQKEYVQATLNAYSRSSAMNKDVSGGGTMPDEPIYYTKKELEGFLQEFKVYVERMRAILQETQELSAHLELQGTKLEQYEARLHAGKQAHDAGVLSVDTMRELEHEFDLITDLHFANGAKMDELESEMAHTKHVIHEILEDVSRDPTVRKESGDTGETPQCEGSCAPAIKKDDVNRDKTNR